ncbi:hypothetical protein F5Y15DRAFT_419453 [Xylariaceae sp. FL0016]|nr:hypothetical protein F5Y15DRAFT_419453 [Xylariaceae sp. FL0016]
MGRPPAYIFIVRHGQRLDAADKQWHLTSPTPYDPPLTYGGWQQSKLVGSRISSILKENEAQEETAIEPDTAPSAPRKKRRYRVIIHSSPFLRCVQTSIAISAGLASNPSTSSSATPVEASSPTKPSRPTQTSSFSNPAPTHIRPANGTSSTPTASQHIEKSVVRLDAFLGEWLSPDYFEHITPPPRSDLMLATAKAELLRRENYDEYALFHARAGPSQPSQLWNSPRLGSPLVKSMTPSSLSPGLERLSLGNSSSSQNSTTNGTTDASEGHKTSENHSAAKGYISPIPSYALSGLEPIPRGYVAHARDVCVDVDYQWDSTRGQLSWGDGGMLGEEWAAMHQRFRRGLRRLIDWYIVTDNPGEMVTKTANTPKLTELRGGVECAVEDPEENEIEDVVVLVSHGAGCNALVGGITQQPVLVDIAMSSLSMACRRPDYGEKAKLPMQEKMASSLDEMLLPPRLNLPDMYQLGFVGDLSHLHGVVTTANSLARSASVTAATAPPRGRFSPGYGSKLKEINFPSLQCASPGGSRSNSANASLGSMRRGSAGPAVILRQSAMPYKGPNSAGGITVGSGVSSFSSNPDRPGSSGLWQPPKQDTEEPKTESDQPMLLDFAHIDETKMKTKTMKEADASQGEADEVTDNNGLKAFSADEASENINHRASFNSEEHDHFDEDSVPHLWAGTGNGGLWGAPRPPGEAERLRDHSAAKRRWTVTER